MHQCHNTIVLDILTTIAHAEEYFAIRLYHTIITQFQSFSTSFLLDMIQATFFKNLPLRT